MRVFSVYFSPTGNTKTIVLAVGKGLSEKMSCSFYEKNFTLLKDREEVFSFDKDDIVILGTPVIAGRVPNLLLPFLQSMRFNKSLVVPVVTFGNRSYDDALRELADICEDGGGIVIGAGAFPAEHSFSTILASDRPDDNDISCAIEFGKKLGNMVEKNDCFHSVSDSIKGRDRYTREYYKPVDSRGNHIDIRKVKPKTKDSCDYCMWCVEHCPLESIDKKNPKLIAGICMKCCSCIKGCHRNAKFFDDEGFLHHKRDLEEKFISRKDIELFY